MKKRTIGAFLLSAVLMIGVIPQQISAEGIIPFYPNPNNADGYNADVSGESILNDMMNQSAPDSFSDDTLTPYATQKDELFTLFESAELFEYGSNGTVTYGANFYDEVNAYRIYDDAGTKLETMSDSGTLPALLYAKAVSFDATGSGKRDHIAIVGYRYANSAYTTNLYIVNAETKQCITTMQLQNRDGLTKIITNLTNVDSNNLIQITAGDYNGDGKDSVVIYSVNEMFEFCYGSEGETLHVIHETASGNRGGTKYLHSSYYFRSLSNIDGKIKNCLCASLDSGDVNGDGIDDLVIISYAGEVEQYYMYQKDSDVIYHPTCIPQIAVGYGVRDSSKTIADLSVDKASVYQQNSDSSSYYDTMAFPDIAIGDIDGDGKNEIIAAGFYNMPYYSTSSGSGMRLADSGSVNSNYRVAYAYYESTGSGNLRRSGSIHRLSKDDSSPISQNDSLREGEDLCQQFSVECVAIDGQKTKEYVFLNGWFYYMDSSNNLQKTSEQPSPFDSLTTKIGSTDVDEVFIQSAAVGRIFSTTNAGYCDEESITLVVGYKQHTDSNKEGSYYFKEFVISKIVGEGASGVQFSPPTLRAETRPMKMLNNSDSTSFINASNNTGLSLLICTVDYGTDSIVAKYTGKAYAYTDPTVVAFLQAAPYYAELDPGNNATTYSYTEGYRVSNGTSTEVSYDIGVAAEIGAGPIQTSIEAGLASEVNQEFVDSIDKTFTSTFEASDQNQVILRQTLIYYYAYDIEMKGQSAQSAMIISAPQYPVLTSLSMDQYNELAAAYNTKVQASSDGKVDKTHKLDVITDELKEKYFLNNEGNPFSYANDSSDYEYNGIPGWDLNDASVGGTDTWMKLSYAGGTQTQAYSVTLEEEKTKSVAEGGFMNMTVMAGGGIGSFSAYVGATAGYERLDGTSISTASMTSTETSGTVQNLTSDLTYYGFDWKLIGWKTSDLFAGVPFVGYAVRNQKDLPPAVTDLTAEYSSDTKSVTLKWTASTVADGRMPAQYYYVYNDLQDNYVGATSNIMGTEQEFTVNVNVSNYSASAATFYVVPYNEYYNIKGMPSNEVYCLFAMSNPEIDALVQALRSDIDELNEALESDGGINDTLEALVNDYEALSAKVADMEDVQEALENTMKDADDALKASIDRVNADLKAAIDQLSEDTETALDDLTAAYISADILLKADIDSLSSDLGSLENTMNAADTAMKEAIDKVNADLSAAIENLRAASDEALQQAIENLTAAYDKADALLKAENDALSENLLALSETVVEADLSLRTSIDKVEDALKEAKQELKYSMTADFDYLNNRISLLTDALETAYQLADDILRDDVESLSVRLDELAAKQQADIDALYAELETLKKQTSEEDHSTKVLSIAGLGIGGVSLAGNAVLLISLLKKRF